MTTRKEAHRRAIEMGLKAQQHEPFLLPDVRLEAAAQIDAGGDERSLKWSLIWAQKYPMNALADLSTALRVTQADALAAALRRVMECPIPYGACVTCKDVSTKALAAYDALKGEG